jgi:hypothetical protein
MSNRNAGVERCQSAAESRGGIALYQNQIGLFCLEDRAKSAENTCGGPVKRLTRLHGIKFILGPNGEDVQRLAQHVPVLPGRTASDVELLRRSIESPDYGSEFDGFWTRSKNAEDAYGSQKRVLSGAGH